MAIVDFAALFVAGAFVAGAFVAGAFVAGTFAAGAFVALFATVDFAGLLVTALAARAAVVISAVFAAEVIPADLTIVAPLAATDAAVAFLMGRFAEACAFGAFLTTAFFAGVDVVDFDVERTSAGFVGAGLGLRAIVDFVGDFAAVFFTAVLEDVAAEVLFVPPGDTGAFFAVPAAGRAVVFFAAAGLAVACLALAVLAPTA
ncbi:MAG: hypothetical protein H0T78_10520 [Longispora sp.]|nr:hypothetical protein [Longispora sp. (in: high G+C Gram-positive bacteria)]